MSTASDTTAQRDPASFQRMAQHIDPQASLLDVAPLHGGVSAQVQVFTLQRTDGSTERVVVRRHGVIDRSQNPQIAGDEFRLLSLLQAQGLPVARPIAVDATGETAPDGIPWLAVAFVEGSIDLSDADLPTAVPQMAAALAAIHRIAADDGSRADGALAFLPLEGAVHAAPQRLPGYALDTTMLEQEIRDTLAAAAQLGLPANQPTLLHGDYWPGNLLWHGGELAAVLDWEDACTGDPLADLATARLELAEQHSDAWADAFTEAYRTATHAATLDLDWTALPWWDLRAALRMCGRITEWGLTADEEAHVRRRHSAFVRRAFAQIAAHAGGSTPI